VGTGDPLPALLLFAAGLKFILVSIIIYAPASSLFAMTRREQDRRLFSPAKLVVLAVSIVGVVTLSPPAGSRSEP